MLQKLRKFSNSFFAKIFLFIVAIPFVFWGMGDLFQGGSQNTIVHIGKEKISTSEFVSYVNNFSNSNQEINKNVINELLSNFIGQKLIHLEIQKFDILLSDNSLAKIIKNQKIFKKDNMFSRTKYEKFLIENGISATIFEKNISAQEKRNQLLNFIGSGIAPSAFIIDQHYNKINQKRKIQIINLNDIIKTKIKFSEKEIETYFTKNKDSYKTIYKSLNYVELKPETLIGNNEFSDLFFKKIDQIDDLIVEGKSFDQILKKFNIQNYERVTFDKSGKNKESEVVKNFPNELIVNVFNIHQNEPIVLVEMKNKYFIIKLAKTEKFQKEINDLSVKKDILLKLKTEAKRKYISNIINKINNNNFSKLDFDKISVDNNAIIEKIVLQNQNDEKVLKKNLVNEIYKYPQNKVIVVADIGLIENYLVYIDKIENVSIKRNSSDYKKYSDLSKTYITNDLYNTYDVYLRNKYKIKINHNALENIKNYF